MAHTPKAETLQAWANLTPNQNPLRYMDAIPDKAKGSKYGCCGIRIDGTPEFVDAVLSCLKPLLDGENHDTRLELSRSDVQPVEINGAKKTFENASHRAQVCYIRLHERGRAEGKWASRVLNPERDAATLRLINA
jgi:hypothetical protein